MKRRLAQLSAMLRIEFLLHWRRRTLAVMTLSLCAIPLYAALTVARERVWAGSGGDVAALILQGGANLIGPMMWAPAFVALALILPPAVADAVPRDRQLGVRELLDSLPLTPGTYLFGKLLGLWASLLAGLAAALAVCGLTWLLAVGPFSLWPYLAMGVLGAGALAVLNGGLTLLLAADQPTGRRAVFVGVAFAVTCVFLLGQSLSSGDQLWLALNPVRPALLGYFLIGDIQVGGLGALSAVRRADVGWTLAAGSAQLLLVWLLMWGWLRWRSGRA